MSASAGGSPKAAIGLRWFTPGALTTPGSICARALPRLSGWTALDAVAPEAEPDGPVRASMVASTLSAGLEFVKDGALDMRQLAPFAELYLRARPA